MKGISLNSFFVFVGIIFLIFSFSFNVSFSPGEKIINWNLIFGGIFLSIGVISSILWINHKKDYLFLAEELSYLHILIFFISVASMISIFFSSTFKIHSALWLFCLGGIDLVFGFQCPLTTEEYKLRKKAGEKLKPKKFIPTFLKKMV